MGQPVSQTTYQSPYQSRNKSWLARPGEGSYKRWTAMHILLRISQWAYPKWKPYAMMHIQLQELASVLCNDHYVYVYMKFKKPVAYIAKYNAVLLRPFDTYYENISFLRKKGVIYEHEYVTCEEITEEEPVVPPQQPTQQWTSQPANEPTGQSTDMPTDSQAKQKAPVTAKAILDLTPEQAMEQLTLEQYDLYCKYKK